MLIKIWKNKGAILEGINNRIFKKEHVEEIAKERMDKCDTCEFKGDQCLIPGTGPCCNLCGCSLSLKIRSLSSFCDNGVWDAVLTQKEEDLLNETL